MTTVRASVTRTVVSLVDDETILVATVGLQGPPGAPATGNSYGTVTAVSADYTVLITDFTIIADTTDGDVTVTLPLASTAYNSTTHKGLIFNICKVVAANSLIIQTSGSDTILAGSSIGIQSGVGAITVQAYGPTSEYIIPT